MKTMRGRERIRTAFACKETDRAPWVPFVGCHAGHLIGKSAQDVLRSADLMTAGAEEAIRRYKPDGIPVTFDLQIEAEALGCQLAWAAENPPSVASHVIHAGNPLESLAVPRPDAARIGVVLDAARRIRAAHPDTALYGLVTGPYTLALHLLGTDIFMKMYDDPPYVQRLMTFCSSVARAFAGYYVEAGCDVIAVVDPMTSQIGPDQFREFVTHHVAGVFADIRHRGALSSFFVCGHAQQNVEAMCECRPDNISVDENIPLEFVRDICLPHKISFGGNMQLTSVLLLGTPQAAQQNAVACMEAGRNTGYILSPGCDLPYATPPANLEAVAATVFDPYRRDVVKAMSVDEKAKELLDMRDYGVANKVIVDIITLDSEACAPCQYMVESVRAIAPEFEGIVEWREHKIKQQESLVFMTSLMVKNIPTICIDGRITFVSRIPARDELISAIQKRINEKLRLKIRSRRASIHILGDGGKAYHKVRANVKKAMTELGAEVDITLITDQEKIQSYGFTVGQTPVVIMTRYQTKSVGSVPDVAIIKEWIKDVH